MIGMYITNKEIFASDGNHLTNDLYIEDNHDYLDFLLDYDSVVFYDLDAAVASILSSINLTYEEGVKLLEKKKLFIVLESRPYTLSYYPGKFFSINLGAGYNKKFVNCYNCRQFESVHYDNNESGFDKAKSSLKTAKTVLNSYANIGIQSTSLVSPINAFVKADRYPKTATLDDIPEGVAELSHNCIQGNWLESYKLGSFPLVYDYDIRGAYGFELCNILDTRRGDWIHHKEELPGSIYGFAHGNLKVDSPFSPFLYGSGEMRYTPTGLRETTLTKQEIDFLYEYKLGTFECDEAWWWIPNRPAYNPFKGVVTYLWKLRKDADSMTDKIIKRIIAGIWGYCSQTKGSGDNLKFGDYFNPVVASIVETNCRLKVARTVLDNDLSPNLINIAVDGLTTTKQIPVGNGEMGSWRLTHQGKGISISSGILGIEGKGGDEDFSISYDKLLVLITANPESSEYVMEKQSPCTLAKAINEKDISKLGELELIIRTIAIESDAKRQYLDYPKRGKDILNNVYESSPIDVSLLVNEYENIEED